MARLIEVDDWKANLVRRIGQLENAGAIGATLDLVRHTLQPIFPEPSVEYLDPARPKPRPIGPPLTPTG